ncbi:MAG TPA: hypothetical protein VJ963_07295, partial [Bacteroidales bacterium]|nr:hypothetical protein [Bacteroidales bacterium]
MTNRLSISLLLIIGILSVKAAAGQGKTDYTDILKEKFNSYCKMVPREEIYSQTDRSEYIAGETAWFSLFVINRQTGMASDISSIVYVELLNSDNRPVVQKKIKLKNSYGEGELDIPDTLSTGSYTMRAYTSWMKNFLPDNCFSMELKIYNVLSTKVIPDKILSRKILPVRPGNDAVNRYNNRDISILTDNSRKDSLSVLIITDSLFRSFNRNRFYLFIQTHGIIDLAGSYTSISDTTRLTIAKAGLSCGINQITAFGSDGKPVTEKYIYTSKPDDQRFTIRLSENYHTRERVSLDMDYKAGSLLKNDSLHLSISVSPFTGRTEQEDIAGYLLFGSEYGPLPHYMINGRKLNEIPPSSLDSILSAISSNWIDWSKILESRLPDIRFKPEKETSYLAGRLLFNGKQSHDNEIVIMCSPGENAHFQYCRTDSTGNFKFITRADNSEKDLILMPDNTTDNPSIIIDSPFSDIYPVGKRQAEQAVKELPVYIPKWMVNYQVETIYGSGSFKIPVDTTIVPGDTVGFYGKPDFELIMSDYI